MKPITFTLAFLVVFFAQELPGQTPSPAPTDSARLQGAWIMLSGGADGFPLPASYVGNMKRVLTGNDLTVTSAGQLFFRAMIRLDPGQTPRTIDYLMTGGPTVGAVQRGIYMFSGDTVKFSFGAPNAPRPADFTSTAGDGRTVSTWIRALP